MNTVYAAVLALVGVVCIACAAPASSSASPLVLPDPVAITNTRFPSVTGQPQVLYTTPITIGQFTAFGLNAPPVAWNEPPMVYVLVKGDFDVSNEVISPSASFSRAQYIAYVMDLRAGVITTIAIYKDTARIADVLQRLGIPVDSATPAPTSEPSP